MLAGLSALELGRLRMSVGYGGHRKGRPLSPVEVGSRIREARRQGASLEDCAKAIQLAGTGHIGRFLRILELPDDLSHLVDWGSGKDFIGFTSAVELVRFHDADDQRAVAQAILSERLNSKEVRQVAQLRERSGRSIDECLKEILGMRPTIERRYVFIGSNAAESVDGLRKLSQMARDEILRNGIAHIDLQGATGRLGTKLFTLVGDDSFNQSMQAIGKENIEALLRTHISEALQNVTPGC